MEIGICTWEITRILNDPKRKIGMNILLPHRFTVELNPEQRKGLGWVFTFQGKPTPVQNNNVQFFAMSIPEGLKKLNISEIRRIVIENNHITTPYTDYAYQDSKKTTDSPRLD